MSPVDQEVLLKLFVREHFHPPKLPAMHPFTTLTHTRRFPLASLLTSTVISLHRPRPSVRAKETSDIFPVDAQIRLASDRQAGMEKLILRSVMYGADKIPDSWFDKIPGNFYKPARDDSKMDHKKQADERHHRSDHHHRSRRYSAGEESRGQRPNLEGDRSEGERHRSHRRGRSSYDGGEDDRYSGDDRHRRRRHGGDRDSRQSRNNDDHRYGYRDGYGSPLRDQSVDDYRAHRRHSPQSDVDHREQNGWSRRMSRHGGARDRDDGIAPKDAAHPSDGSPLPTQPPAASQVYVPYAHLYGGPKSTSAPSSAGSVQPNAFNQVTPSVAPRQYHQNVDAQQAPTAAAAGAGAMYDGQPGWLYPEDPRWDPRYANGHNGHRTDRGDEDLEHKYISRLSSTGPRSSKDDRSPSDDSFDAGDRRPRRSDRGDSRSQRTKSQSGRGKSRVREMFDPSQRGLGYSAVGALAGGLVGSEIGSGIVPIGLGVAAGAIGANAFQARERYVKTNDSTNLREPPYGAHTSQHRGAARSTLRTEGEEMGRTKQLPLSRRKEDERHSQWIADGTYARREEKRRGSGDRNGYHSD
nr:hypothetical protein CFP56_07551 [Quercus suber]